MRTRRSAWQNRIALRRPIVHAHVARGYTAGRTPSTGGVPLSDADRLAIAQARRRGAHAASPAAALAGRDDVALVPTMGALHDGHRALLRAARASAATVVMSLFVNPGQFGPGEDFDRYPRDEEADVAIAAAEGADLVFAPGAEVVYPDGFAAQVDPGPLADRARGPPAPRALPRRRDGRDAPLRARATAAGVLRREGLPATRDRARRWRATSRSASRSSACRPCAMPTASRSPRATASSRRPSARARDHAGRGAAGGRAPYAAGERDADLLVDTARARLAVDPDYLEVRRRDDLGAYDPDARPSCSWLRGSAATRLIDNLSLEAA